MKQSILSELKERFGPRATDALYERKLYARDLAPVPRILVDPLFRTLPDIIVAPENTEEVAELLRLAWEQTIPVTPRAGASTVYFNSVPVKGGIVIDLNRLQGIINMTPNNQEVRVWAGTTWKELDDALQREGWTTCSQPSSAPVATIGGWFNMMGYGIGSLKYGSLLSQVLSIQVVLPDGEIRELDRKTDPSLEWFACSEGTLGIVCQLTLKIRPLKPMQHYLIQTKDRTQMAEMLTSLAMAQVLPYNLHYHDKSFHRGMHELGLGKVLLDGCTVGVDFTGEQEGLQGAEKMMQQVVEQNPGCTLLPEDLAAREWEERYKALRLKRGGPSQLGGEIWLPIQGLGDYLEGVERLGQSYNLSMMSYGEAVDPKHVTVMTMFYADESETIAYILSLGLVKKIHDIGHRYGGYPYGIGLWNSPYVGRIFAPSMRKKLRKRKKALDERGIMNPGKVYKPPLMLNPLNFAVGMAVFGVIRHFVKGGHNA